MRRRIGFIFLFAVLGGAIPAARVPEPTREYVVKAAFIYNFIQFAEWPADSFSDASSPFVIGVIGSDPFDHALEAAIEGKSVGGHPMVVKQLNSVQEIDQCRLLFVPAAQDDQLANIFNRVAEQPILTVGESDNFPWAGGVIRFYMDENKVHFEISPEAASKARIRLSSKLMKLAKIFKR